MAGLGAGRQGFGLSGIGRWRGIENLTATFALKRYLRRIALVICAAAVAQPAAAITLEQAVADLVAQHPQIQADRELVSSANQRIRAARSAFLPQFNLTADWGVENVINQGRRAVTTEPYQTGRERVGVTLTQNVYDDLLKVYQTQGAEFDKGVANATLRSSTQNAIFEGINAYIDVIRQHELFDLIRVSEQAVEQQFKLEEERLAAGAGLAVDLLLARQRLQLAKERSAIFNGNLQNSLSRYRQVFDELPEVASMVVPIPPIDLLPTTVDEAVDLAIRGSPIISSSIRTVDSTRMRQRAAASGLFPRIDVVGAANFEEDVNMAPGVRRDWSVLVQATWNLFSGFATQANMASAAFDHASGLNVLQMTSRRVEEEVRVSWQGLLTACERRFLLENAVNIALDVLDSWQRLQEAGQETAMRVLDAETEVFNAQINLASAAHDETITVYRMMLAVGKLESVALAQAASASRRDGATITLINWCRQYTELDLRAEGSFLKSTPTDVDDDPFGARGGDEDEDGDDDVFKDLFGDDDEEEDDPFESIFGDDEDGDTAPDDSVFELEDDDVSGAEESAALTGESEPAAPAGGDAIVADNTLSADSDRVLEDGAAADPLRRRRLASEEDFESDDEISRQAQSAN